MKCIYCQKELPTPSSGESAVRFCPFCGKSQEKPAKKSTEAVIRDIAKQYGESILRDKERLVSFFSDLAPEMKREKNLLKFFADCDGNTRLLEVKDLSAADQKVAIAQITQKMQDSFFIDPKAAELICKSFLAALSEPKAAVKSETVKKPAQEATPAKIASDNKAPEDQEVPKTKMAPKKDPGTTPVIALPSTAPSPASAPAASAASVSAPKTAPKTVQKSEFAVKVAQETPAFRPTRAASETSAQYTPPAQKKPEQITDDEKKWAFLAYWGIIFIFALIKANSQKSKFIMFHCMQSASITVAGFVPSLIVRFVPQLFPLLIAYAIVLLIFAIVGMMAARRGECKKLPFIWNISERGYNNSIANF